MPVIDFLSRYISAISLAAVAALSAFNIGYFWKIGLHFIGLIELSNLVYSAGLALVSVGIWLAIASLIVPRKPALWKTAALLLIGGALSIWGIFHYGPRSSEAQLVENGAILIGFTISGAAFSGWSLQRYRITGVYEWREVSALLFVAFSTLFQAGSFTAALELSDRVTYMVNTKSDVIESARILRSSSAGFVLAANGLVIFVPQAEIKSVKSNLPHKQ
jgi:hypothetical protein